MKPAVLHVINALNPSGGGPSRTVPALCEAVAKTGEFRIFVLTTSSPKEPNLLPDCSKVTPIEVQFTGHPASPILQQKLQRVIQDLHLQHQIKIIHDHGQWLASNRAAASVSRRLKIPRIISPRGMLSPWALGRRKWLKRILWTAHARRDLQSANRIHSTSQLEKSEIEELGVQPPIDVVPNGIDFSQVKMDVPTDTAPKIALFLSRVHPKKGLDNLLQAWSRLRPNGWKVIIAGPDEDGFLPHLRQRTEQLNVGRSIDFIGPIDGEAKWALYRRASLFVLPSYSENFGVVVGEALASGLPVITTRATPWELLETNRCGWWIDPNADALESSLRTACAASQEELAAMGQRGREAVLARFSWDAIGELTAESYLSILNPR